MSKRSRDESGSTTSQADVARRGLVSINKLDYTLQPDLSVCVSRSGKKHFFQQSTYAPGSRAILIVNSGAEYVDPQNSYLSFTVVNGTTAGGGTASVYLGAGSGVNFIRRIILTTRSGDEIERVEGLNQLAPLLDRYLYSKDWLATHGSLMGYGTTDIRNAENTSASIGPGASRCFVIPLSAISGLFRTFDRLLPSMLMSGLRFEIEWAPLNQPVFTIGTTPVIGWTIASPELMLDQYQLTDSIQRVLNESAAMNGLEIVFSTFYNHSTSTAAGGTSLNIELRKAVSRALGLLTKIRRSTDKADADNMVSFPFNLSSYQVRIGSLYFPQQPIKTMVTNSDQAEVETYFHTLQGLGKIKTTSAPTGVTLAEFKGTVSQPIERAVDPTEGSMAAIYTDLERSSVQNLTGIPINNSRVAEVRIESKNALFLTDATVETYLHYVRLLRVFLQNTEVEE